MTGELFSLMRQHSVLGRLMPFATPFDGPGFDEGFRCSRDDNGRALSQRLFSVRACALLGELSIAALPDYLSVLLAGYELVNGLRACDASCVESLQHRHGSDLYPSVHGLPAPLSSQPEAAISGSPI